jgi:hypothetical protein
LGRGLSCATNTGHNGSEPKPRRQTMEKKILYVGMDVHKKSIDVAISNEGTNGKVRSYGKIDGTLEALDKLIRKLKSNASDFILFMRRALVVIRFIVI